MIQYNTVEEALEELRKGHIILVTDDADRENEGDFICAAEFATTENINFMAIHGKGLICIPSGNHDMDRLDVRGICREASVPADGFQQYGQS